MTRLHRLNQRADLGERESPRDECLVHCAVMENWRQGAGDVSPRHQVQSESGFAENPLHQWDFEMDRSPVMQQLERRAGGRVPPSASGLTCIWMDLYGEKKQSKRKK